MLDKYSEYGVGAEMINVGGPGNTGDSINMLLDVGAVTNRNIGTLLLFPFMRDKAIVSETNCAGFQPYLWVDKHGRRFTDEVVGLNFGHAGDIVAGLPGAMYWAILGQEQIRKLTEVGNEVGLGIYVDNYAKLPGLRPRSRQTRRTRAERTCSAARPSMSWPGRSASTPRFSRPRSTSTTAAATPVRTASFTRLRGT